MLLALIILVLCIKDNGCIYVKIGWKKHHAHFVSMKEWFTFKRRWQQPYEVILFSVESKLIEILRSGGLKNWFILKTFQHTMKLLSEGNWEPDLRYFFCAKHKLLQDWNWLGQQNQGIKNPSFSIQLPIEIILIWIRKVFPLSMYVLRQ